MQPLEGPSSTWVEVERYLTWSRLGAEADKSAMVDVEAVS